MTLPVFQKSWQITKNVVIGAEGEDPWSTTIRVMVAAIAAALAMPVGAPTVLGSSDGTSAAHDAVNRWAPAASDPTILAWGYDGAPRSWLLLSMPGVATGFQLLFVLADQDLADSGPGLVQVYASTAGFTGGDATHRPGAGDEVIVLADPATPTLGAPMLLPGVVDTSSIGLVVHVWLPTDGSALRVVAFASDAPMMVWLVERPLAATPGWLTPYAARLGPGKTHRINGATQATLFSVLSYDCLWQPDAGFVGPSLPGGRGIDGGMYGEFGMGITLGLTGEGVGGSAIGQLMTLDAITQDAPILPIGLFTGQTFSASSPGPYSFVGRRGTLADLWWGSITPGLGSTYPGDGSRQLIQIGHLIFPWDGAASFLTSAP